MNKEVKTRKQLIILGNGFDLSCGLKSTYNDFFEWRLKSLFKTNDVDNIINQLEKAHMNNVIDGARTTVASKLKNRETNTISNRLSKTLINYNSLADRKEIQNEDKLPYFYDIEVTFKGITRWDIFFIYAKKYLQDDETNEWQDIERIIDNVLAVALHDKEDDNQFFNPRTYQFSMNLHFKGEEGKEQFKKIIYKYAWYDFKHVGVESRAHTLLIQLLDFEKAFSQYIYLQMGVSISGNFESPYFKRAESLLREITDDSLEEEPELNVWSFNYTLGPRFQKKLNDEQWNIPIWNNIHGLACYDDPSASWIARNNGKIPAPIFGIDPEDNLSLRGYEAPARVIFTKPYRIINNKFNSIRQEIKFNDYNKIIVYGHSLGEADYSYFKYIFDETRIYTGPVKLIFYYWPGLCESNPVEKQLNERKYTEVIVKILNLYGKDSSLAREDIVTKLAIEGRLTILPNPEID